MSSTHAPLDRDRARRMRTYPLLVLLTLGVVVVLAAITGAPGEGRIGGDYPAFYGAGSIVLDGDTDGLYDAAVQRDAQEGLLSDEGEYLYFAYPPGVAAAYAPLAAIGFTASYLVHAALMTLAVCGAVILIRPMVPIAARFTTFVIAAALLSYPLLRAVIGGQNTALSLLLLAWAWRAEHDGNPVVAGLAAGLLLFKPQFGVPLLLLALGARRLRMVAAGIAVGAGWWVAGAVIVGPGWIADWWPQAREFAAVNADVNGANFIGLAGLSEWFFGSAWPGWILAVATAVATALWWFRAADGHIAVRYAVAAPALVLVAPQALFYEAGLVLVPVALLVRRSNRTWAAGLWAATWSGAFSGLIGGAWPLAVVTAVSWAVVWRFRLDE